MVSKIKLLRSGTLQGLEGVLNDFFADEGADVRVEVDLVGGITYANDDYVAAVRITAPHKRHFEDDEDDG